MLVAKFHEKCKQATETLEKLKAGTSPRPSSFAVEFIEDADLKPEQLIIEDPEEEYLTDDDDNKLNLKGESPLKNEQTDENYDYMLFDETDAYRRNDVAVGASATTTDDNNIIEEVDEMYVMAEYLNSDTEELVNNNRQMSEGESEQQMQSDRTKQHHRIGSPKYAAKVNINHCCKICGAGFAQLSNLTRHLTTHTNPAPDDVVACGKCNMTFDGWDLTVFLLWGLY